MSCANGSGSEDASPNVVLILADDMGYGDAGVYNPESKIPTPHIDRLAHEGVRLTDAHSPSAVCTPTRYALLTGRYAWRTALKKGVLWGHSTNMIDTSRVTLPSMLKEKGYVTGGVGKWHLGLGDGEATDYSRDFALSPIDHGFDYFYGIPASLDMPPYVYFENRTLVEPATDSVSASAHRRQNGGGFWRGGPMAPSFRHAEVLPHTTDQAVAFIENHGQDRDTPFFLYVPFSAPHTPWLPDSSFRSRSGAGYYGDFTAQVDASVGRILDALDRLNLSENTLVMFTSDNGAHWYPEDVDTFGHRANLHLRGQKADIWEGGHRVPFLARWPGVIPAGAVNDETVTHTDLLATLAGLVGYTLPSDAGEDSYDIWPALLNRSLEAPIREATVHHALDGMFAIRQGPWKYVEGRGSGGFTHPQRIEPAEGEPPGQLYHLMDDPSEERNVYADHPDLVHRMQSLLDAYRQRGSTTTRRE